MSSVRHPAEFDLRHIRSFLAVAEHGSIRRAAIALGAQSSTISRQIRSLEENTGVSLFERHGSGVRPTSAGSRLAERLRGALASFETAFQDAQRAGAAEEGELLIGFYTSLASGRLRSLLGAYSEERPGISLQFTEATPTEQLIGLRSRSLDAAFLILTEAMQDFQSVPLWTERVHVALPDDHVLATSDVLTWERIRYEPFIVRRWANGSMIWYKLAERKIADGIALNITQHDVSRESLLGLVAAGHGLTVVSEAATGMNVPGLVYRPIDDRDATVTVRLAWMPDNDNPALRRFISFAKSSAVQEASSASPAQ